MIRVAICEDDIDTAKLLCKMLEDFEDSRECKFEISVFFNGREMMESNLNYQIAFLDVDMPEMNGIELGKVLWKRNKQCFVIYITNLTHYREIAQNQVHSFAYLKKPVDKEKLFLQIDDIISSLTELQKEEDPVYFESIEQGIIKRLPKEILYFEHSGKKLIVSCFTETFQVKSSIGKMAEKMEKYDFIIPHNAFLVNLNAIRSIKKYEIILHNGKSIPLSQRRAAIFRKLFAEHMK